MINFNTVKFNNQTMAQKAVAKEQSTQVKSAETTTSSNPFRVLPQGYMPVNFTARAEDKMKQPTAAVKKQMLYAEAVVNNMKNKYGCISPSKVIYTFNKENRTKEQEKWLQDKQKKLENLRYEYPCSDEGLEFAQNILSNVSSKDKDKKIANCYEYAKMAETALRANGFKNVTTVKLVGYTNPKFKSSYDMDHNFVVVNGDFDWTKDSVPWNEYDEKFGKNAFVVDPWLGIVDTVENAMKIYQKTWENIPHYRGVTGYSMEETGSLELSSQDVKKIRASHPELIVNKETADLSRYEK